MNRRSVWVVGGIAWDTVLHVPEYPTQGGYVRGTRRIERPGGSAGNVARALATTAAHTSFATTLGNDERGNLLHAVLEQTQLDEVRISWVDADTEHVLVIIDGDGDRTIIGLSHHESGADGLAGVDLGPDDIVVFVAWEPAFLNDLALATNAGCTTVVGLRALLDPRVAHADIAFGSHADVPVGTDPRESLDRFERIVMTWGSRGATQYSSNGELHQPAFPATPVDTTGAGDAFLAGYLAVYAAGATDGTAALAAGARWAAAAIASEASVPPPWPTVDGLDDLLPQ